MSPIKFIFLVCLMRLFHKSDAAENVSTVWVLLGSEARLKCPFTSKVSGDRPIIILWQKGANSQTIYSYDARKTGLLSGSHWQHEDTLGTRAHFEVSSMQGQLAISHVGEEDRDVYTCRVEYQYAATSYARFNLSVIVPPNDPVILWKGKESMGILSPISQQEEIKLTCQTSGGYPTPSITWLKDGKHLSPQQEEKTVKGVTVVASTISFTARRDLHMASLVCQALPRNPSQIASIPVTTTVRLNLTLPPNSVKITGLTGPLSAETTRTLECLAYGSSPPAEIEIWKGHKRLSRVTRTVMDGGNITKATVSIQIKRYDHRTNVTCKAFNPSLKKIPNMGGVVMDVISLDVYYEPEVKLQLGKGVDPAELLQDQRAYLECLVKANPPSHKIEWLKEGLPVSHHAGIALSGTTLTFSQLDRTHSGKYRCSAANLEGKSLSNTIEVNVKYPPICSTNETQTQGVALHKSNQIKCKVDADPWDDLTFTWHWMNASGILVPVEPSTISFVQDISYLTVSPNSLQDYGSFTCSAANSVGYQKKPCVVKIVPAGPPEDLSNCVKSFNSGLLHVNCKEGFDGGLPQAFHMEVWHQEQLVENSTKEFSASWEIDKVESGTNLTLKVYSSNLKGISTPVFIDVETPVIVQGEIKAEEEIGGSPVDFTIIFGSIAGFVFMLLLILLIGIIICCQRRKRKEKSMIGRDCSRPDVISSIRNRPRSHIDVLDHERILPCDLSSNPRIVPCISSCGQMHERCHQSSSNSSLESDPQARNNFMHSMDFALELGRPKDRCCKHCNHTHSRSMRQISASANQLTCSTLCRGRCCKAQGCYVTARNLPQDQESTSSSPTIRRHREVEAPLVEEESADDEDEGVVVDTPSSSQTKCEFDAASRSRGLYDALQQEVDARRNSEAHQKTKNRAVEMVRNNEFNEAAEALLRPTSQTFSYKESAL